MILKDRFVGPELEHVLCRSNDAIIAAYAQKGLAALDRQIEALRAIPGRQRQGTVIFLHRLWVTLQLAEGPGPQGVAEWITIPQGFHDRCILAQVFVLPGRIIRERPKATGLVMFRVN